MNTRKFSPPKLFAAALLLPSIALAQPNTNNAPIAQNPPNQTVGGGRGNRGPGGRGGNLTAAERQLQTRQRLIMAGVEDAATRDVLVAHLEGEETARQTLREKWNTLATAARNQTTTDTQLAALLNDFRGALDEERARREKARAVLDTKLALAKNPRLDAQLMLSGLLGDEAAFMESGNQGGRGGRGGFGGF